MWVCYGDGEEEDSLPAAKADDVAHVALVVQARELARAHVNREDDVAELLEHRAQRTGELHAH